MHSFHALAWLIEHLVKGDPVAWAWLIGAAVLLAIAFVIDVRNNIRKARAETEDSHTV